MLIMKNRIVAVACALALGLGGMAAVATPAGAAVIGSTRQGVQQWPALNGKLILVAGIYQDTTSYKRSLTFFFEEKPGGEWLHVPIIESEADHTLTWFSISAGEITVADAAVKTQGSSIYLIVAEQKADKSGISANWYKLSAAGDKFAEGPAYVFASVSNHLYPKTRMSVEDVIKKETALTAKK